MARQKKVTCPVCGKYMRSDHLKRHAKVHRTILTKARDQARKTGCVKNRRCVLCLEEHRCKSELLHHMKTVHGILQPYQCFACLKRYASYKTLWMHRQRFCRGNVSRKPETKTGTYSISSYIDNCRLDNWTSVYGDRLECLHNGDAVAIIYCGERVGYAPQYLSSAFSQFLWNGTIFARIAGAAVDYGNVFRVPVDYICHGENQSLVDLIAEVEEQAPEDVTGEDRCYPIEVDGGHDISRCVDELLDEVCDRTFSIEQYHSI